MESRRNDVLYIDGQLVDIDENTNITLSILSNLLGDVSKIKCNTTYTIKLPRTARNQRILGFSNLVQTGSSYPYKLHPARYFRGGVEIIKNGSAAVMSTNDKGFEIAIVWGLFPAFSKLLANGMTLNQLESDARILYEASNNIVSLEEAQNAGYFYAGLDVWRHDNEPDYSWVSGARNGRRSQSVASTGASRSFGGARVQNKAGICLHPSVKVSWLLDQIKNQTGVEFQWTADSKDYVDSLIIPLVQHKANALTYSDQFAASLNAQNGMGFVVVTITKGNVLFREAEGTAAQILTATSNADVVFDVSAELTFNVKWDGQISGVGRSLLLYVRYKWRPRLVIKVTRGNDVTEYECGSASDSVEEVFDVQTGFGGYRKSTGTFDVTLKLAGYGAIELQAGDKITFELVKDGGDLKNVRFNGGMVTTFLADDGDEVPVGGYFPIAENLPEIKVIDFVKFLAAVTGTFPVQHFADGVVSFVPMSVLWKNRERAKDWTRKVIAPNEQNNPMEMTFKVSDYAQHNLYKWKSDDTVQGNYDGDLVIGNETLDIEKTIFEFPFAASDGNCVPMYTEKRNESDSSAGVEYSHSDCQPRVLRMVSDEKGKAQGVFDMNMQNILADKYAEVLMSLQNLKVIKESIRVSDVELLNFDETVPIYLAQYGRYFAVLEIKAAHNGFAEVTMLQMVF